jgi:hypothetical protein
VPLAGDVSLIQGSLIVAVHWQPVWLAPNCVVPVPPEPDTLALPGENV